MCLLIFYGTIYMVLQPFDEQLLYALMYILSHDLIFYHLRYADCMNCIYR